MTKTQIPEDELKEVGELNSVLFNEKQELEAKLAEESRAKDGNHLESKTFGHIRNIMSFLNHFCLTQL
jgi:hypothetical protein